MAQTLILREMFDTAGTLTSGSPGSFSAIPTGSLYKRPIGPRTSGIASPGRSAAVRRSVLNSYWDLTTGAPVAAAAKGSVSAWVRFAHFGNGVTGSSHPSEVLWMGNSSGSLLQAIAVDGDGRCINADPNTDVLSSFYFQLNTWYYLVTAWSSTSFKCNVKPLGGTFTEVRSGTAGGTIARVGVWNGTTYGGPSLWGGRVGGAGLYSIAALGDELVMPSDLIDPVEERHSWYVNPATGNDTNDGISSATPWLTTQKIIDEINFYGIIGSNKPWVFAGTDASASALSASEWLAGVKAGTVVIFGDTINIDTSTVPLQVTNTIPIILPGLCLTSAGSAQADLRTLVTISPASWTKTGGYTNIYQNTNTQNYVMLWEDRKWLNHPVGANLAAVGSSLDSTPGSFWNDGTTLYYHATNSSNPVTSGKTLERTLLLGASPTGAENAIEFGGNGGCKVDNISVGGVVTVQHTTNNYAGVGGNYGILTTAQYNVVSNCYTWYTGKHGISSIEGVTGKAVWIYKCRAEQGTIYTTVGGQSPFVVYGTPAISGSGLMALLTECICLKTAGLVGSASGTVDVNMPAFLSHNAGGGGPFASIVIENSNFSKAAINGLGDEATQRAIRDTRMGEITLVSPITVERCILDGRGVRCDQVAAITTIRNSIIIPDQIQTSYVTARGAIVLIGCTIDANTYMGTLVNSQFYSLFNKTGTELVSFTMRNCVFIVKTGEQFGVLGDYRSTDTVLLENNAYKLGTSKNLLTAYNDGAASNRTLAQTKALGIDVSGIEPSDLMINSGYQPLQGSPLIDAGKNLGAFGDYTGKVFDTRNDIGAYEYVSSLGTPLTDSSYDEWYQIALGLYVPGGMMPKYGSYLYDLAYQSAFNSKIVAGANGISPVYGSHLNDLIVVIGKNKG